MTQPLHEPALLVSDNCPGCRGTGRAKDGKSACSSCEGAGREVRELPLSEAWELAHRKHSELVAEPPSAMRDAAVAASKDAPPR